MLCVLFQQVKNYYQRIMERFELERTLKSFSSNPPAMDRDTTHFIKLLRAPSNLDTYPTVVIVYEKRQIKSNNAI